MTLEQSIRLNDGMTEVLYRIHRAMNMTINTFERMQSTAEQAIPASAFAAAHEEINRAGSAIRMAREQQEQLNSSIQRMPPAINSAVEQQQNLNNRISQGEIRAEGLLNKIKHFATAIAGAAAVGGIINLSDSLTQTTARLNLMNDGMRTTDELQKQIFASAQRSRGSFLDMADAVSQMGLRAGNIFASNDETIAFVEQLNKQFAIAGASQEEMRSATLQLTQALGSGVLRGEEFNAVFESAPNVMQTMADYIGVDIGQMRELASDGEITAATVKNAMLAAIDETNAKFESMPKTFSQVGQSIQNNAVMAFRPVLQAMNDFANSEGFETAVNRVVGALIIMAGVALEVFQAISDGINWIGEHWSLLEPVILTAAAAMLVYKVVTSLAELAIYKKAFAERVAAAAAARHTEATFLEITALKTATGAQIGLNAALYACPLTWIVVAIIAIVGALYVAVAAINHFAGKSISATGLICGAFMFAVALIGNIFVTAANFIIDAFVAIWNIVAAFAAFIARVFDNPIDAIILLFCDLADVVLHILQSIASAIDTIFGSHLANVVQGWRNGLKVKVENKYGEKGSLKINSEDMHLKRFEYGDALNKGYNYGANLADKFSLDNAWKDRDWEGSDYFTPTFNPEFANDMADTAYNTGRMADQMEITEEDLKYLRDIAEREAVNRFTTAEIKLDMTNYNTVNGERDLDGMVDYIGEKLLEQMAMAAEGVHI